MALAQISQASYGAKTNTAWVETNGSNLHDPLQVKFNEMFGIQSTNLNSAQGVNF